MIVGLAGAFAAAVCYGAASVLQAVGARRTSAAEGLDVHFFARLLTQLPYVVGLALDGVGFVASVLALRTLPLFLVQSAIASSVGVTAVLAMKVFGTRLSRTEVGSLVVLGCGLLLLAVSARPETAHSLHGRAGWLLLAGVVVVLVVGAAGAGIRGTASGAVMAAGAGLGFSGVGVAARVLVIPHPWWHAVRSPVLWALIAYGAVAMLLFGTSLQRATVTVTTAVTFTVETCIPAAVGLVWLGDSPRQGFAVAAGIGFALALGGALALARHGEPVAAT